MSLSFSQIEGYLKHFARLYQDSDFEYWELINESWLRVHNLKNIKFVPQGIIWAIKSYKDKCYRSRRFRNEKARVFAMSSFSEEMKDRLFSDNFYWRSYGFFASICNYKVK